MDTFKAGADIWRRASHNKLARERAAWWAGCKATLWSWVVAVLVAVPAGYTLFPTHVPGSLAAVAAIAALVLAIANPVRESESRSRLHQELANNYGRIAQRARRLDKQLDRDSAEACWLVDSLQRDMELQKGTGREASQWDFNRASTRMKDMKPYPFDLELTDLP
jgi:hypothetical protein